jgi:putative ABC transport system ATP-binding protein
VAIARALINEPDIILADEPTGALDMQTSKDIMELISSLHKQGKTIIMVTHEPEVARYAQRIIYLKDGIVADSDYILSS